jgi:hypothetical protein
MNRYTLTRLFFLILLFCLLFSACSDGSDDGGDPGEPDSTGGSPIIATVYGSSPRYFSLTTGREVKGNAIASTAWDIAFPNNRQLWTNSGDSALQKSSNGQGGVWHTDSTNFDSVTLADKKENVTTPFNYADFNEDKACWVFGMTSYSEFALVQKNFNVMSYVGFDDEDKPDAGLFQETAYSISGSIFYLYDKKAFYTNDPPNIMPPNFVPTGQVYIVRHGDGVHYSKIQVNRYVRASPKETLEIRYENLN